MGVTDIIKLAKKIMATVLALTITVTTPLVRITTIRAASGEEKEGVGRYVSEFRVGMGETADEAKKELEAEGFTILKDDSGSYADLNVDAGSKSALKRGANDKIVYLGYKTTGDLSQAVTDLAVMNMNGGYSIEDYNMLMDRQMESQIKPFVERFLSTLNEYRENYKKPEKSLNHIRADYMRRMLNRLTDDDTGGQPMGDLLLNETKYEMGDKEYDKLSDEEKKNHADILTLLMQANGKATLTIEMLLTRATDTGKDTWVDRFRKTTPEDLEERIQDEDSSLTTRKDVLKALDRRYHDTALALLKKWKTFQQDIADYQDKADDLVDDFEDTSELVETVENIDIGKASEDELEDYNRADEAVTDQLQDMQKVMISAYLESVEYKDSTLLEFFKQDYDEVSDDKGIRNLYPIVDSLSDGQIAGLDFVSFADLFQIALADKSTYKDLNEVFESSEVVSVYENVDREIYEKGGVALTSDALRAKANSSEAASNSYKPSALTITLWASTAGCAAATVVSSLVAKAAMKVVPTVVKNIPYPKIWNNYILMSRQHDILKEMIRTKNFGNMTEEACREAEKKVGIRVQELWKGETGDFTSSIAGKLSIGFAVVTVLMTIASTVMTILEAADFYDTEYIPIPKIMVDEADITAYNEKGEKIMIKNQTAYYRVVSCNRTTGDSKITKKNYEAMGDSSDLNGDIGTQWLALYAVKYENGAPILADSLIYQKDDKKVPDGYNTGIHEFGSKAATNLNNKHYLFREDPPVIKVFFKTEKKTAGQLSGAQTAEQSGKEAGTGSVFSGGSLAMGGGVGLIVGGFLGALIIGRRKKKTLGAEKV